MQIFLRILKEIGIAIVILGLLLLLGFFLFRDHMPFLNSDIPNPIDYKGINYADFDIVGDLEDQTDPTKRYEATTGNLRTLEQDRKVHTGAPNPFVASTAESDIPSERVSIDNSANPTEKELADLNNKVEAENKKLEEEAAANSDNHGEPVAETVSLPEE